MKIGITAFGSPVRGLFKEEMSHSNAAIIEEEILKSFIALDNSTEFYILKNINRTTKEALQTAKDSQDQEKKSYADRFHVCETLEEHPEHLDLLYVQMGSDNLRQSGRYAGIPSTNTMHYYVNAFKYPTTPILYIQTDFACPLYFPQTYGPNTLFNKLFPHEKFVSNRKIYALLFGSKSENGVSPYQLNASYFETIRPIHVFPDLQLIINLPEDKDMFTPVDSPKGVCFGGKNRIKGSRDMYIREIFFDNTDVDVFIIGNWFKSVDYVKQMETNPHFKISDRYFKRHELLTAYNEYGFTFYTTCPEYQEAKTITSRLADSLIAGAVPLIYYKDFDIVRRIFGELVDDLKVESREDVKRIIEKYQDVNLRSKKVTEMRKVFKRVSNEVRLALLEELKKLDFSSGKGKNNNLISYDDSLREFNKCKKRCKLTEDQISEMVNTRAKYDMFDLSSLLNFDDFVDILKEDVWDSKICLGLLDFSDRTTLSDVPDEILRSLFELYKDSLSKCLEELK